MSRQIDTADRITNKYAPSSATDRTLQNANILMEVLDNILDGKYANKEHAGTTAQRPATPEVGDKRWNTDFTGFEIYTGSTYGWKILDGIWTISTRPDGVALSIAPGSRGWNVDIGQEEYWNGSNWDIR